MRRRVFLGCFLGGCRVGAGVRKEPELQYSVHLSLHLTPGIQSRIGEQCNSAGWRSRWRCSAVQLQKPVQKYHQRRPPDALTARHYRCCSQYPAKPHLLRPSLLITASGFVHSTRWLMWQMPIREVPGIHGAEGRPSAQLFLRFYGSFGSYTTLSISAVCKYYKLR